MSARDPPPQMKYCDTPDNIIINIMTLYADDVMQEGHCRKVTAGRSLV